MRANAQRRRARESGQTLVLFALMVVAMIGILALVIDLGFLFGQRRFDQNGADAAALAAGRLMAGSVTYRDTSGNLQFFVPDATVYQEVLRYAGLDPYNPGSSAPTGVNQNPGLNDRNALAVSLEYGVPNKQGTVVWCYSPSGSMPSGPGVVECALPKTNVNGKMVALPPYPSAYDYPYRIRVTVSSTTDLFFAPVIGVDNVGSAQCIQPSGATGGTTCAQAVVAISGVSELVQGGSVLPITTAACQFVDNKTSYPVFELWTSNPETCGEKIGGWKNYLDFTSADKWCDNQLPDYDDFCDLLPALPDGGLASPTTWPNPQCQSQPTPDWNRDGFVAANKDNPTEFSGTGKIKVDVPYWIARGFPGAIKASYASNIGNKVPTYGTGDLGQNLALAFYCDNDVEPNACSGNPPALTYYFAQNQPGFSNSCSHDPIFGGTGAGCRDAAIPIWGYPEEKDKKEHRFVKSNSTPDRVQIVELRPARIFCDHAAANLCTQPPKSVVDNAANSTVYGEFISPTLPECPPSQTCTGGPTIYGNYAYLEH